MEPDSGTPVAESTANTSSTSVIALVAVLLAVPLLVPLVVAAAVIPGVPWWVGIPLALLATGAWIWIRLRDTVGAAVGRLGGVPADESGHARLANLVQGLALHEGVIEPELYVIDDPARNLAPLAQGDRSAIVVTSGLLTSFDRIALEAVVAEAMVRIGSGDAAAATLGTALLGPLVAGPLGVVTGPVASAGFRMLLPEDRDLVADRAAVQLTRYPPGLLTALDTIRSGTTRTGASTRADQHLWMAPPNGPEGGIVPRASLDLRMDVLGEL